MNYGNGNAVVVVVVRETAASIYIRNDGRDLLFNAGCSHLFLHLEGSSEQR